MGSTSKVVSVAATETIVLRENPQRRQTIFSNDSANTIYLTKGDVTGTSVGIRLNGNGGTIIDSPDNVGYLYKGVWKAIAPAGASNLGVTEDT